MKRLPVILLCFPLFGFVSQGHAQTAAEWLQQKKTAKQYLLAQLEALAAFRKCIAEGYTLTQNGLRSLKGLQETLVQLHQRQYQTLSQVSAPVKSAAVSSEFLPVMSGVLSGLNDFLRELRFVGQLGIGEIKLIKKIIFLLLRKCYQDLDRFGLLVSGNALKMSDGERLYALQKLSAALQDTSRFAGSLIREVREMGIQRTRMLQEEILLSEIEKTSAVS